MLGIIGGSSLGRIPDLGHPQRVAVNTPYGDPSAPLTLGDLQGTAVVFLARHGDDHVIAPHRINYRANLWALHAQGVREVVAVATVGGIRADLAPGTLLVPDQIIDYTHGRDATFFDGELQPLKHVDFTRPFDGALRNRLLRTGGTMAEPMLDGGVYGATQGPRLETAAEIERMARDGADVVGMTGMPEAALARELGIDYALLCVVVNAAAGRGANSHGVAIEDIAAVATAAMPRVIRLLAALARQHGG